MEIQSVVKCQRCIAQGHPSYFGSEVQCAFPNSQSFKGELTGDHNWQCATVGALRELLHQAEDEVSKVHGITCALSRRDDQTAAMMHCEETGWLFFTWYKSRGACEAIWDERGQPVELEAVDRLLNLARSNGFVDEYYRPEVSQ